MLTSSAKHQALAVLASRDHPDANVRVLGFPGLASKLALSSKSRVRVVDLLADNQAGSQADAVLHRSIRLGALEAEGVAVAVESGGAAVLLIEHHDD